MKYTITTLFLLGLLAGCKNKTEADQTAPPENIVPALLNYNITNIYPHNTGSYTEGLEWHDSTLYESTGNYGQSKLARISLQTGKDIKKTDLAKEYYGEGITVLNGKIYQLTYMEGKCFVYDFKTFKKIGEFTYKGEGWGMTNDGKYLIMNNSTNNLYFRNPETFEIVKVVPVFDNNGPLDSINELEFVNGFIYSNVFTKNDIVKIDPVTGRVVARADFSYVLNKYAPGAISDEEQNRNSVLNGIAYDSVGKRFFITGKNWPKLFEVKFN